MVVRPEHIGSALFIGLLALVLLGASHLLPNAPGPTTSHDVKRDLARIRQDTLRVLVLSDPLTWEQRPGATTGLEWELLERFARRYRLVIKPVPVSDPDRMLALLHSGGGDILAAQLTPSGWAAREVLFTRPYRHILPAHAEGAWRPTPDPSDTLTISRWSPFLDSLQRPLIRVGQAVVQLAPSTPEELLVATAMGHTRSLLVSNATARFESKRLPTVQFTPMEGEAVPLVFGVRANAPRLLHLLDTWLATARETNARQALFMAYDSGLETRRGHSHHGHAWAFGTDSISPFDSLFQQYVDSGAWNWKLLAAMAFRESNFDTTAVSSAGAGGLMQLMPRTATLMGLGEGSGVGEHIQAANGYLAKLDSIWRKSIPSPQQRLRFVLASYNAGPGHVRDGQRLARLHGLDPQRWDDNVERAIVLLNRPHFFTQSEALNGYCRCQDTYWYVREVTGLYAWLSGSR